MCLTESTVLTRRRTLLDEGYLFKGEASLETTSYAAYGQAIWDWTESTMLTAGIRYSYFNQMPGNVLLVYRKPQ
jgi:outer membrane receptor protein involved in Fe transport